MEHLKNTELLATVPDIDRLLELADIFYSLECPPAFLNVVMEDAKGLHDAKRRLFFLLMALVVHQQDLMDEAGVEHHSYDPFELYNDVLDRYAADPEANNRRELSFLPKGDGLEQVPVDFDRLTAMVSERLHLNERLPKEKVLASKNALKAMPPQEQVEQWVREVNCFVRNEEGARHVVDSAIYATSNAHLGTCIAHPLTRDYGMDKEALTGFPFCHLLEQMVRYSRNANAEGISRALLTAVNKP